MIEADVLLHLSKKAVSKSATELDFDNGKTVMFAKSKHFLIIMPYLSRNKGPLLKRLSLLKISRPVLKNKKNKRLAREIKSIKPEQL